MKKRNSENIGEVIQQFFEENQTLKLKIAESRVLSGWYVMLGQTARNYTTDIYFRQGTLFVRLNSSVFRQELSMAEELLIKNLNKHAGMQIVQKIILR